MSVVRRLGSTSLPARRKMGCLGIDGTPFHQITPLAVVEQRHETNNRVFWTRPPLGGRDRNIRGRSKNNFHALVNLDTSPVSRASLASLKAKRTAARYGPFKMWVIHLMTCALRAKIVFKSTSSKLAMPTLICPDGIGTVEITSGTVASSSSGSSESTSDLPSMVSVSDSPVATGSSTVGSTSGSSLNTANRPVYGTPPGTWTASVCGESTGSRGWASDSQPSNSLSESATVKSN